MKRIYEETAIETAAIDNEIFQAELELANGGLCYDARETLAALRKKHFSKTIIPCSADTPPIAPASPGRPG